LRAPAHDAQALAAVLQDPEIGDFKVSRVVDQPEAIVRRQIAAFFANRSPQDTLLAHFSCHGVKDESGQLFFAASDTELAALDATALPAEFVNTQMNKSRSRRIVLLLDCCYSGAFARGMQHRASEGVELQERFEGRGRAVLTASSAMEYAFDGDTLTRDDASPSVFTSAVVQGLRTGDADRDGDGYVSVDELYDYVFDEVRQRTPSQTPHRWFFDIEGDLVIATAAHPTATKLPAEVQDALDSPFPGARLDAVRELARLLAGRHRGLAAAARDALEILGSGDDSRRVQEAAAAVLTRDSARIREEQERVERRRMAEEAKAAEQARVAAEREEQERVERQGLAEAEKAGEQARVAAEREEQERLERQGLAEAEKAAEQARVAAEREEQERAYWRQAEQTRAEQALAIAERERHERAYWQRQAEEAKAAEQTRANYEEWRRRPTETQASRPPYPRRLLRMSCTTLWALVPILTFGFFAPAILLHIAIRMRYTYLWVVFALSTAATAVGVPLFYPSTTGSVKNNVGGWLLLLSGIVGSVFAFKFRSRVFPAPSSPRNENGRQ
jgi:hypothetical protein